MNTRQDLIDLIEMLSDEQIQLLMPLVLAVRDNGMETASSEASEAYQSWVGAENDIYDEIFADEMATR